jgi:hypothetical protein
MGKFVGFEPCPECRKNGRDNRGDNFVRYKDGGGHCFSCGHHEHAKLALKVFKKEDYASEDKAVLPADFTREVPANGWKWLLQYGLPYSYWKRYTGYSPKYHRLVLTFGDPVKFSIGRLLEGGNEEAGRKSKSKWVFWGDGHGYLEILGDNQKAPIVLVEDLISAHKVAQVFPSICLFGTHIHDLAVKELIKFNGPVVVWLDEDQYHNLPKKVGKLQTFLKHPVKYVYTNKDPKEHTLEEIKRIVNEVS